MAKTFPFDTHPNRYEGWFVRHEAAYQSELLAVRALLPWRGRGLEVGVGTGRFAGPLGIEIGVDPSLQMLTRAKARGIRVAGGIAEALPFADEIFDYVLIVVTICFVDDVLVTLREARRVLKPDGTLVIGFLDPDSEMGGIYLAQQTHEFFYTDTEFYTSVQVEALLLEAGFVDHCWGQTLCHPPDEISQTEPIRPGHGEGVFVVVRARKS